MKKFVLPYVRTGDFEELHSSFLHVRGRQFHRDFFILPCKGYVAKGCTKTQVWRPLGIPPSLSSISSRLDSCGMPVPSK